jgi:hypothetical protein
MLSASENAWYCKLLYSTLFHLTWQPARAPETLTQGAGKQCLDSAHVACWQGVKNQALH